jgi:hypothetical protein
MEIKIILLRKTFFYLRSLLKLLMIILNYCNLTINTFKKQLLIRILFSLLGKQLKLCPIK